MIAALEPEREAWIGSREHRRPTSDPHRGDLRRRQHVPRSGTAAAASGEDRRADGRGRRPTAPRPQDPGTLDPGAIAVADVRAPADRPGREVRVQADRITSTGQWAAGFGAGGTRPRAVRNAVPEKTPAARADPPPTSSTASTTTASHATTADGAAHACDRRSRSRTQPPADRAAHARSADPSNCSRSRFVPITVPPAPRARSGAEPEDHGSRVPALRARSRPTGQTSPHMSARRSHAAAERHAAPRSILQTRR